MSCLWHLERHASRHTPLDDLADEGKSDGVDAERVIDAESVHVRAQRYGSADASLLAFRCTRLLGIAFYYSEVRPRSSPDLVLPL
jgi:hypothetical protein